MGELIATLEDYSIYKAYSDKGGNYFLCVPSGNIWGCQIFLGFSEKDLDTLSNDEVVSMISDVNSMILEKNNNSIYVVPNIPVSLLKQATFENDDRMYLDILNNKIHPITTDVYNMLIKNGVNTKNINQVIQVVEKNDMDKKLGGWLSMKLGDNFIKEIEYQNLKEKVMKNDEMHELEPGYIGGVAIPISDGPLEQIDESHSVFNSEINPIKSQHKGNKLVKKLIKPNKISHGFSSIKFIVVTLLLSLVVGVTIGYLIMK